MLFYTQLLDHCQHSLPASQEAPEQWSGFRGAAPDYSLFHSSTLSSQAFSEYQIQQMTANFVDQFGFNDEEFADQDDNIK